MNEVEAAQQLQTIRTLMERAALYRRALGPTLLLAGVVGCLAALVGWAWLPGQTGIAFARGWLGVAALVILTSCALMRQQALRAAEPFWTPPARRIASAMLPPLTAGAAVTIILAVLPGEGALLLRWLPPVWLVCYGLAVHAAGFFTLRGVRWLGWIFVLVGAALGLAEAFNPTWLTVARQAHAAMGATFGLGHLLAGAWLLAQERNPAA